MTAPILEPAFAVIDHPQFPETATAATSATATAAQEHYTVFTSDRKAAFLGNLQLFGNVRNACKAACVSAQTAYRARRGSPGFRLAWDTALLAARGHAEATLADRAISGVEEAVFYHGEEIARRRRYDSRLLLAHLARLDRLEDREDVSAMLERLDECIAGLEQGVDIDETLLQAPDCEEVRRARGFSSQDSVPSVPSCRKPAPDAGDWDEEDVGAEEEDEEEADVPALERRLSAMEAARPDDALPLADLARVEADIGLIEAAQLAAFEAGEARWWEVVTGDEWDEGHEAAAHDPASATHSTGVSGGLLWDKERD